MDKIITFENFKGVDEAKILLQTLDENSPEYEAILNYINNE